MAIQQTLKAESVDWEEILREKGCVNYEPGMLAEIEDQLKRPVILPPLRSKLLRSREITSKVREALQEKVPVPESDRVLAALKEHQDLLMRSYVETTDDFSSRLEETNRILHHSIGDNKRTLIVAIISAVLALASLLVHL